MFEVVNGVLVCSHGSPDKLEGLKDSILGPQMAQRGEYETTQAGFRHERS